MENGPSFERQPSRKLDYQAKLKVDRGIKIKTAVKEAVQKEVTEALVKHEADVQARIQAVINNTANTILDDKNIDTQRGLLLMVYEGMISQIERYKTKIAKEEAKKGNINHEWIQRMDAKIDALYIKMPAELRKLNEGQHTMRFGRRNININATVPRRKSVEDLQAQKPESIMEEKDEDE